MFIIITVLNPKKPNLVIFLGIFPIYLRQSNYLKAYTKKVPPLVTKKESLLIRIFHMLNLCSRMTLFLLRILVLVFETRCISLSHRRLTNSRWNKYLIAVYQRLSPSISN
jgi:hypothetical protein